MTRFSLGYLRFAVGAAAIVAASAGCGESFVASTGGAGGNGGNGGTGAGAGTGTSTGGSPGCSDGDMLACYTGQAGTEGVGLCTPGTKTCMAGQYGECIGETLPAEETCDGADNDCDGQTDEGCPCTDGAKQPCFPGPGTAGVGPCKSGEQTCVEGSWGECTGAVVGAAEVCNGKDDDCNGTADDVVGAGNVCSEGGLGICAAGKLHCDAGKGVLVCVANEEKGDEICDALDNDCNGVVDDLPGNCTLTVPGGNGPVTCQGGYFCNAQNQEMCGPLKPYFADDFSSNAGGWTLGNEWQIGPAMSGSAPSAGNPDPSEDHTSSADNRLAGVVIGGSPGGIGTVSYMTSKQIPTGDTGTLFLSYWRWLNTTSSATRPHSVEVSKDNGANWVTVWNNEGDSVFDAAWTYMLHDLKDFAGQTIRVRFGFKQLQGIINSVSSWNVDDVVISSCPAPPNGPGVDNP
ncbi:MAG: MopE-related protein [Polyangiaceae bacterium]